MKEGWKMVKLGEVVSSSNGLWKGKKPPYIKIAVIRNTNFTKDCRLKLHDVEYIDAEVKQFSSRKLEYGDIIIEKSGGSDKQPVGRPILFNIKEGDFSYSNFTSRIRITDNRTIDSSFLQKALYNHYLKGSTFPLQSNTTGIHNLDFKGYLELEIPLPPLEEQHRIVSILDAAFAKIDALKANAEANLKNAKALFQQVLAEELKPKDGWVEKKLGEIYDVRDGTHDSPKYHSEGYPFVTSKNLINGIIDMNNVQLISKEDYDKINERSKVDLGDVLFAMIGSNLGHPAIVDFEPNFAIKNVALFKIPSNQSNKYLLYLLSSDMIMGKMNKNSSGSSQPFVSLKFLRNFIISIPSLSDQHQIVQTLDALSEKCRRLEQIAQRTIDECDALKQSILRRAFSGEL